MTFRRLNRKLSISKGLPWLSKALKVGVLLEFSSLNTVLEVPDLKDTHFLHLGGGWGGAEGVGVRKKEMTEMESEVGRRKRTSEGGSADKGEGR